MGIATVDAETATKTAADIHSPATWSLAVPMVTPATRQTISTSSLTTVSTAPVTAARAGLMRANTRIQAGDSVLPCRVNHWKMPNAISADPKTTRSQDAQVGGDDLCIPPNTPEPARNSAVN